MAIAAGARSTGLNNLEIAFLEAVLAHRGIHGQPTDVQLREALEVMVAYIQQAEDNPPEMGSGLRVTRLSGDEQVALAAIAFLEFGVTKPSTAQRESACRWLFGPQPCAVGG